MKTIGFLVSSKEHEARRALLPSALPDIINRDALHFECGYAIHMGIADEEYHKNGCHIAPRSEILACDIICDPKPSVASDWGSFRKGQILFGWIHAVQGRIIVDSLLEREMSAIAWEDMFEGGRHCFWRNNEIAGEAAVLDALRFCGRVPSECYAAIIGLGNCGRGAFKMMSQLGMKVTCFTRETECQFRAQLGQFDIVVNAVLWDIFRRDHLICREDLSRMKLGALIIDISCDEHMGIESSRATSISQPVYTLDGITHYAVDHCPAIFYKSASQSISAAVSPYIDELVEDRPGKCIQTATVVREGQIVDERIKRFQNRPG